MIRLVRRLFVMFAIFGVLFFAGNLAVKQVAESKIGSAVRSEFDLSAKPSVSIGGSLVGLDILEGHLTKVSFTASSATFDGLKVDSISVVLVGVKAPGGFLRTKGLTVTVTEGTVNARATDASINAYLADQHKDATVALHEGSAVVRATRTILGRPRKLVARGTVAREGNDLVFRPRSVTVDGDVPPSFIEGIAKQKATVRVRLPELPAGISTYEVRAEEGALAVVAVLHDEQLILG
jgi:DUF2993 family protein